MNSVLDKQIKGTQRREQKLLRPKDKKESITQKIYDSVPQSVLSGLENAFEKAFEAVFLKGIGAIEKTFDKDKIVATHGAYSYAFDMLQDKKSIGALDKIANGSRLQNHLISTVSGLGMGLLGAGLPDVPVFIATVLRSVYQIAISYGFTYESREERLYILRIIRTSLLKNEEKTLLNQKLSQPIEALTRMDIEIKLTAKALAEEMLLGKFVQGMPIVGAVGGIYNFSTYKKITDFAAVKYKLRYLKDKGEIAT